MALRRCFLRSLRDQNDGGAAAPSSQSSPSQSSLVVDPRRAFLASLREAEAPTAPVVETPKVIEFSISNLRAFLGNSWAQKQFKKATPVPEKRPNYNSSKRKFYAQPTERISFLGFA